MKRILITGANSYIGTSFEKYIKENFADKYEVDTVDMIDGSWREKDFSYYDVVYHVAGIAHIKETKENARLYYDINRDLAIEVANKAKFEGVKQFVFLSSMSVYGIDTGVITKETLAKPKSSYGKSKYEAEIELVKLNDNGFKVSIMRPPMVYGEGCKGNYNRIIKLVKKFPFFPRIHNKRSMLHIDNLSSFVELLIDSDSYGLFFPQNEKYVDTMGLARRIADRCSKKIYFSWVLGFFIVCLMPFSRTIKKAFGNLIYKDTDDFNYEYCKKE